MNRKKTLIFVYSSLGFILLMACLYVFFGIISPSYLLEKYISASFNNPGRVDSLINNQIRKLILLGFLVLLFFIGMRSSYLNQVKHLWNRLEVFILKLFSLKVLFTVIIVYLGVLFYLAISRYDLGVDEASYPLYAKHFWDSGFAYVMLNGKMWIIDNYAMLPMYIASVFNFVFNLTDVWHFKFLASLLSLIAIYVVSKISRNLYNSKTAVLFIFFLVIQPGFGFVASSFIGEIVQASFFFTAVYIWLKDDNPADIKKLFLVSLLFAVSIQTKLQIMQSLIVTLFIFHFVNSKKKPLAVLALTITMTLALAILRFIPALIQDKNSVVLLLRFWATIFSGYGTSDLLFYIDRAHFFDRFLPVIFFPFLFAGFFIWSKTAVEKFLTVFTLLFFLWWIMYFKLTNYRIVFIGIIPLCFLLAAFTYDYYHKILEIGKKSRKSLVYISSACCFVLMVYGFSQNLIYAVIGNNDAAQFDLDETTSRLFKPIKIDNSQKVFYNEAKTMLLNVDSIYIPSGGQACFVPQFYLGENRIFDYKNLTNSLQESPGVKYVIIDRIAFPLGLIEGYRKIDSLNVQRNLLLKNGDYELFSVYK